MNSVLDAHCHTVASGHAYSTVTECAGAAAEAGLELIAITDHAPKIQGSCSMLHFLNLKTLPERICGVSVLSGVELNIMDRSGRVDLSAGIIKRLDVVIASMHIPCIPPGTAAENTEAVVNAMKNPLIRIIGHLGDPRYPIDTDAVVGAALETRTAIEINESSSEPGGGRSGGEDVVRELAEKCLCARLPVIMGSDSHYHTQIGRLERSTQLLDELGFPDELVLNTSVERFLAFIGKE